MDNIRINFIKTHPKALLPKQNHSGQLTGDTGYDIFAVESTTIPAFGSAIIPTGIEVGYISPGYWFKIEARSGLGFKYGLFPHFGIIDNGYRGNLGVKIYNASSLSYTISEGQACAQLVLYPIITADMSWIDFKEKNDTLRGSKGFGSSDIG